MIDVDVQLACDDPDVPGAERIRHWVVSALSGASAADGRDLEVGVRVVSAEEMQALNKDYREQDRATNVLSFPAGDVDGLPDEAALPLGDIIVCADVVRSEAATQGKPIDDHWAHMLVHGTLHLLGYDHIEDIQAILMENLETAILTAEGVVDPYRVQ